MKHNEGQGQDLQQGRIEGALVVGLFSAALIATSGYFLVRQFRKEEQRNQDEMFNLLDDMTALQREFKHPKPIPVCVSSRYSSASGKDLAGHTWQHYVDHLGQQYVRLHHAKAQAQHRVGSFQNEILDVHASIAETLDAIIAHFYGPNANVGDGSDKIGFCERNGLISAKFARRLRDVYVLCNGFATPGTPTPDIPTQEQTLNAISQARALVKLAETLLIPAEELREE